MIPDSNPTPDPLIDALTELACAEGNRRPATLTAEQAAVLYDHIQWLTEQFATGAALTPLIIGGAGEWPPTLAELLEMPELTPQPEYRS